MRNREIGDDDYENSRKYPHHRRGRRSDQYISGGQIGKAVGEGPHQKPDLSVEAKGGRAPYSSECTHAERGGGIHEKTLIYVDRENDGSGSLKRYKKDSFYWYRKVIASNGADLQEPVGEKVPIQGTNGS